MESRFNDEDEFFDQVENVLLDEIEDLISDDEEDEDYLSGLGETTEDTEFHQFNDSFISLELDEEDL